MAWADRTKWNGLLRELFQPKPPSLRLRHEIDRGSFGAVYLAEWNGKLVAAKGIHELLKGEKEEEQEFMLRKFKKECSLLEAAKHPCIVTFYGAYYDEQTKEPLLVMERMSKNLRNYLKENKGKLELPQIVDISLSIAKALHYLHNLPEPIVHCDLNDKNVMLTESGVVKVGDMGESRRKMAQKRFIYTKGGAGAVIFMPPEALTETNGGIFRYNEKLDSFSAGVLMLEIATQTEPKVSMIGIGVTPEVQRRKQDLALLPDDHPMRDLILDCLEDDCNRRPDARKLQSQLVVANQAETLRQLEMKLMEVELEHSKTKELAVKTSSELQGAIKQMQKELKDLKLEQVKANSQNQEDIKRMQKELKELKAEKESERMKTKAQPSRPIPAQPTPRSPTTQVDSLQKPAKMLSDATLIQSVTMFFCNSLFNLLEDVPKDVDDHVLQHVQKVTMAMHKQAYDKLWGLVRQQLESSDAVWSILVNEFLPSIQLNRNPTTADKKTAFQVMFQQVYCSGKESHPPSDVRPLQRTMEAVKKVQHEALERLSLDCTVLYETLSTELEADCQKQLEGNILLKMHVKPNNLLRLACKICQVVSAMLLHSSPIIPFTELGTFCSAYHEPTHSAKEDPEGRSVLVYRTPYLFCYHYGELKTVLKASVTFVIPSGKFLTPLPIFAKQELYDQVKDLFKRDPYNVDYNITNKRTDCFVIQFNGPIENQEEIKVKVSTLSEEIEVKVSRRSDNQETIKWPQSPEELKELMPENESKRMKTTAQLSPVLTMGYHTTRDCDMGTKYIAAIDFGSAFTGVAFAVRKPDIKPNDIMVKNDWKKTKAVPRKVPTSVLFNKFGQVIAYGYEAEARASDLEEEEHALFRHFKMSLHSHNMKFVRGMTLTSLDGRTKKPALELVSKALKYLGILVKDFIKVKTRSDQCPENSDITWVITVPAIWNFSLRQFMREAVKQANLCSADCSNLVIALEPECAALYLEHKHKDMRRGRYAIVDCGGGTVDVSYHQCQPSGQSSYTIHELKESTGEPKGGTLADRKFEALMDEFFGYGTIEKLKREHLVNHLSLMKNFEMSKPNINDGEAKHITYFRFLPDRPKKNIAGISIDSETVRIEDDKFSSLFQEPVDWIRDHLAENMCSVPSVERLYFTGGFSQCKLLQDRVMDLGPEVIVPDEEELAVVKGAVIFGNSPDIVKSRVMPMSYGIRTNMTYDPVKHKGRETVVMEGVTECIKIFDPLVRKGDTITDSDEKVNTYSPVYKEQKRMSFPIYISPDPNVQYTDDPSCEEIGSMTLDIPDTTGGTKRSATVVTTFTGKELHTWARSERDNTEINCILNI